MKYRHLTVVAWLVAGSLQSFVIPGLAEPAQDPTGGVQHPFTADFRGEAASDQAMALVNWVVQAGDHQSLPFVVVDKAQARVFVFNGAAQLLGAAPALVGFMRGDDGVPGLGDRPLSRIRPKERITPSGRFVATLDSNVSGQNILWVDYDQAISMHAVRSVNPSEHRLQRLASDSVDDKRISYGCINVSAQFWQDVLMPTFADTEGIVYVLPETRAWRSIFALQAWREGTCQPHARGHMGALSLLRFFDFMPQEAAHRRATQGAHGTAARQDGAPNSAGTRTYGGGFFLRRHACATG